MCLALFALNFSELSFLTRRQGDSRWLRQACCLDARTKCLSSTELLTPNALEARSI